MALRLILEKGGGGNGQTEWKTNKFSSFAGKLTNGKNLNFIVRVC